MFGPVTLFAWAVLTILILVFALIFWKGDGIRRSAKPLQGPVEKDSIPEERSFATLCSSVPASSSLKGQSTFCRQEHRYYVIVEGILGWLLLALFLVTLGRITIR